QFYLCCIQGKGACPKVRRPPTKRFSGRFELAFVTLREVRTRGLGLLFALFEVRCGFEHAFFGGILGSHAGERLVARLVRVFAQRGDLFFERVYFLAGGGESHGLAELCQFRQLLLAFVPQFVQPCSFGGAVVDRLRRGRLI